MKQNQGRGAAEDVIVVAVPVELKSVAGPIEALIAMAGAKIRAARGTHAVDYARTEKEVQACLAAIERATHVGLLDALDVDVPRVEIGGRTYRRVGRSPGSYRTMAGEVKVERTLYREGGLRLGKVTDAISLRAGVVGQGWLPRTATSMAHSMQAGTSRDAKANAEQLGRMPYSRASFDRLAHEVGELWLHDHADIEDQITESIEIPAQACSISVALDRVSLPMEEPRPRPRGRPRKGAPKRPIERVFRMAYCGTVTLHDADGTSLHTVRYGCMPQSDAELLCCSMANEVYRLRERRSDLTVSLLADGAVEMWNLLEAAFPPAIFGVVTRRVDFWHLIEKLSPAAKVIHGDEGSAQVLARWRGALRRRSSAAGDILTELLASGLEWSTMNSKQPVHEAMTYLTNHQERMDYADALRKRLPIGSGNVEATCKTLVAVRMKRAGSRWKHDTGEHILRLRALALSDRWDSAMDLLHERRRTAVRPAA